MFSPPPPPRSLSEFLVDYFDSNVCAHADDAGLVITNLVGGSAFAVTHNRDANLENGSGDLVISVTLRITVFDPDPTKFL